MPMSHEARQFHHIMDMVDCMDEDFLRNKVQHLPLYIAAKNFERERLSRANSISTTHPVESTAVEMGHQPAVISAAYMMSHNMMNPIDVRSMTTIENITHCATSTKNTRKRNSKFSDFSRDRSLSTSEYMCSNIERKAPSTQHVTATTTDVASSNNDPSEAEHFAENSQMILNSTPYLGDEYDNGDELSNNPASTSSGSGPVKRRWGPRKSPNSRIAHNMNEKNRRADLRESLEKLKCALPDFHQKNCKSTTSDILQQGYKFVTDAVALHRIMVQQRTHLFEASKIYKFKICQMILENSILMRCAQLVESEIPSTETNSFTFTPLNDMTKAVFQRYLEINDSLDADDLYSIDYNQIMYPTMDFKAIDSARKKYLQTASISIPQTLYRKNFNFLYKTKFLPSSSAIASKKHSRESSNVVVMPGDTTATIINTGNMMGVCGPVVTAPPFKSLKNNSQKYNEVEQFPASLYPNITSPLMAFSMATIPTNILSSYHPNQQHYSSPIEDVSNSGNTSNNIKNSTATSITTISSNCSSTASMADAPCQPNTADVSTTTTDFINTSRSSYSPNNVHTAHSANISDDDNHINTEFYNERNAHSERSGMAEENSYHSNSDSHNDSNPSQSNDPIGTTSSMSNSNSKSRR